MKILISSVTRAEPKVLRAHLSCLLRQHLPVNIETDFLYVTDPELSSESLEVLRELNIPVVAGDAKFEGAEYEISEETHHWNKPTFYWLGSQKQKLLEFAKEKEYDGIWLVDSDLLCDRDTLNNLLSNDKHITSSVFWTAWTSQSPPLPQVWMENPYEMQGRGVEAHEHFENAATRQLWQVGGLGACTLIRKEVLDRVQYYPPMVGLPEHSMWQGEDRTFSVSAQLNHVELWADSWSDVFHCYRPSDTQKILEICRKFSEPKKKVAEIGDLISCVLSPVEEPGLVGYKLPLRGRLGGLRILPSIELALLNMRVGEDKFVNVNFPLWWKIPEYRGKTKMVRVELLGVRSSQPPIGLDEPHESAFGEYYGK